MSLLPWIHTLQQASFPFTSPLNLIQTFSSSCLAHTCGNCHSDTSWASTQPAICFLPPLAIWEDLVLLLQMPDSLYCVFVYLSWKKNPYAMELSNMRFGSYTKHPTNPGKFAVCFNLLHGFQHTCWRIWFEFLSSSGSHYSVVCFE